MTEQKYHQDHELSDECEYINRCLAIVLHYEEVQQIAEVMTKIMVEREKSAKSQEEIQ